jgi:hypothetical protein
MEPWEMRTFWFPAFDSAIPHEQVVDPYEGTCDLVKEEVHAIGELPREIWIKRFYVCPQGVT